VRRRFDLLQLELNDATSPENTGDTIKTLTEYWLPYCKPEITSGFFCFDRKYDILRRSPKSISMVQSPSECIRIIHNTEGSVDYGGVKFASVHQE